MHANLAFHGLSIQRVQKENMSEPENGPSSCLSFDPSCYCRPYYSCRPYLTYHPCCGAARPTSDLSSLPWNLPCPSAVPTTLQRDHETGNPPERSLPPGGQPVRHRPCTQPMERPPVSDAANRDEGASSRCRRLAQRNPIAPAPEGKSCRPPFRIGSGSVG